ncbi:hydroxypyruvate reductase [Paenochrobactrum gallinarii]|uniref:Hydroxypyruvate reductase n=1 Tax=Paenochrobactrum gallinarii TaxID=643673 RepID=A0A841LR64_9HYPH|nr:hydroxypyruvate reductase [Paenochrobactrum gallinarii]
MSQHEAEPRALLTSLFEAAVEAADPLKRIKAFLPEKPKGKVVVIGAGKGSAQMARAFEQCWDGDFSGVVVTRYGFGVPCEKIEIIEASHPVPDEAGRLAAKRLFAAVENLSADDLVIALVSGGGSALLPAPADGLTLADEVAVNEALLASGLPISAMNVIRKHISKIKGGRLAAACFPAKVVSLIVSDIPGDNPAYVASGPTVPDSSTRYDALKIIEQYGLKLPDNVIQHLQKDAANAPLADDDCFKNHETHVIASAAISLEAAVTRAAQYNIPAVILSDAIEGEAREVAHVHSAIAKEISMRDRPFPKPVILLSGGETTVTVRHKGKGGRNTEFLLSLALDIAGNNRIYALAADTDGIDGSEDNAGGFADGTSMERLREKGLNGADFLKKNDAWSAFSALNDLYVTGPTGTNVNDFRAILITD